MMRLQSEWLKGFWAALRSAFGRHTSVCRSAKQRFCPGSPGQLPWRTVDQHYVAGLEATRQRELVAVFRPGKVEDLAIGKVRDLFGWAAVEGLCPQIRDTLLVSNVGQVAPVPGPADYG